MTLLRQFLYVDVDRVRSYLAQLDEGIVEGVTESGGPERSTRLFASILGVGAEASWANSAQRQVARSLQDLLFTRFEEIAEAEGWFADIESIAGEAQAWSDGRLHDAMSEGQLLRLTYDVQVLDPSFLQARLQRISGFAAAIARVTAADALRGKSQRDQERIVSQAEAALWGDVDPGTVKSIAEVFSSLLNDEIAVRVLPCGSDNPEHSFGGVLLDRAEYLQKEREALFSRYGPLLEGWTTVLQVEHIPRRAAQVPPSLNTSRMMAGETISRAGAEGTALELIKLIDQIGLTEGPRWPSITATPLAIYRLIPGTELPGDLAPSHT